MIKPIPILIMVQVLAIVTSVLTTASVATAQDRIFVHAGQFVDVVNGQLLRDQLIVINGERIEQVGSRSKIAVPQGASTVDLADATVVPGLIDMHVHMARDASKQGYQRLADSVARNALHGVANSRKTLDAGFTSVRDLGGHGYANVALRDAIRDGDVAGPRMRVAGESLGITGGHCDINLLPVDYRKSSGGVADGPWAARAKVRENAKYGADVTKFCATGGVMSKGTTVGAQQYSLEEMVAIVTESHLRDRRVAAHAHGTEGIKAAISAGVDSVEHASMIDDEGIRLAKSNGTFLVMDIYVSSYILEAGEAAGFLPESLAKEKQVGQVQRDNFRKAHEAGVRMAFGSDAGVYPHGRNARQFAYMVEYGMTPMEAIQAATVHAAELLDWSSDVGAIAPGMYADLIAVSGNPLEDIRELEDVRFVMKGGEIYKQ